jgi:fibronectin type 3 domain-containing protein
VPARRRSAEARARPLAALAFALLLAFPILVHAAGADATTPPNPPRSLAARDGDAPGSVRLAWLAPTDTGELPVLAYRVYRGLASGSTSLVANVLPPNLTYEDAERAKGVRYFYRVTAVNAVGESASSNEASLVTKTFPPSAPRDVRAAGGPARGTVGLAWSPPADDGGHPITSYRIYRGSTPNLVSFLVEVPGANLTHSDTGLPDNAARHYRVSAVNARGMSVLSVEVTATTPTPAPSPPPGAVAFTGGDAGEILLSWQTPTYSGNAPILKYRVYRSTSGGAGGALVAEVASNSLSFVDTGLANDVLYFYRVTAVNKGGESGLSNEASARTKPVPDAPELRTNRFITTDNVHLGWDTPRTPAALPVTSYRIYRGPSAEEVSLLAVVTNGRQYQDIAPPGGTQHYRISAVNAAGEGPLSKAVSVHVIRPVPVLSATLDRVLPP